MFYILMCFYWFNPFLPHDWNFAGQFLILNLSGNCCHLLNSHSGIFYGCSFKLWYRIFLVRFFIPKPNDKFLWRYWSYDALHGVGGAYAKSIFVDELGAQESSLLNCTPKVLFSCWLMPRIALNILNASCDLPLICGWLVGYRKTLEEDTQTPIWHMQKSWLLVWDWANPNPKKSPQSLVLLLMVMQIATWFLVKGSVALNLWWI